MATTARRGLFETTQADYHAGVRVWRETTEDLYYEMLGVVPVAFATHGTFAMGEPYTHDYAGRPVYLFFGYNNGRYFAQHGTIRDFKSGRFGPLP